MSTRKASRYEFPARAAKAVKQFHAENKRWLHRVGRCGTATAGYTFARVGPLFSISHPDREYLVDVTTATGRKWELVVRDTPYGVEVSRWS